MTVETLSIDIDTSKVTAATAALEKLALAAHEADAAIKALGSVTAEINNGVIDKVVGENIRNPTSRTSRAIHSSTDANRRRA